MLGPHGRNLVIPSKITFGSRHLRSIDSGRLGGIEHDCVGACAPSESQDRASDFVLLGERQTANSIDGFIQERAHGSCLAQTAIFVMERPGISAWSKFEAYYPSIVLSGNESAMHVFEN